MGWELDEYPYSNAAMSLRREEFAKQVERAQQKLAERECHASCSALLTTEIESIDHLIAECMQRSDLHLDNAGITWTMREVGLRRRLAFQPMRRFIAKRTP